MNYKGEPKIIRLKDKLIDKEVIYDPNGFDNPDRFKGLPEPREFGGHSGFHGGGGGFHGGGHTGGGGGRF